MAAICGGGSDWREHLRQGLAASGVQLAEGGGLLRAFQGAPLAVGSYQLLDPPEARRAFPEAAWLGWSSSCPFVGPPLGYLVWNHHLVWSAGGSELGELVRPILREGRGFVARTADGRLAEAVRPGSFGLAELTSRWGFGDGERLLEREEGDFARYACAGCEEALRKAGFVGSVQWVPTSHNPLRLGWNEEPSALRRLFKLPPKLVPALFEAEGDRLRPVRDATAALASKRVELWAHDFSVLEEREFWAG